VSVCLLTDIANAKTKQAARALALLTPEERSGVLRYYHVKDAKLALGSGLLKRLAIVRCAGVPWQDALPGRDARTHKPVFRVPRGEHGSGAAPTVSAAGTAADRGGEEGAGGSGYDDDDDDYTEPLLFNVSHQAGLVVLLALAAPPSRTTAIGVDIVCPSERRTRDREMISREGWPRYVAMHEDVFSPGEAARLRALEWTLQLPLTRTGAGSVTHAGASAGADTGESKGQDRTDVMLAHFYALWCLREGYVKMTGDALLAPWLRDLDMRNVAPPPRPPPPPPPPPASTVTSIGAAPTATATAAAAADGATPPGLEIWLRGERVRDADVRLEWLLGDEYMVCTAVRWGHRDSSDNGNGTDGGGMAADEAEAEAVMMASPFVRLDVEQVLAEAEAAADGSAWA